MRSSGATGGRAAASRRALRGTRLALLVGGVLATPYSGRAQTTPPPLDVALDSVARVARALARPSDARRAGYHRIAPRKLTDLNPLVGEHWINERLNRSVSLDLAHPAYLMYFPLPGADSLTLVGVGYTVAQPAGSPPPAGFHGAADRWHVHLPCAAVPDLQGILAESIAQCEEVGGTAASWQIAMVHVWTVPNPDGPFGQFNPALPFVTTGIAPPTPEELADPAVGTLFRELGLALGETFGGVPRMGAHIAQHPDSAFADKVRPHRRRIGEMVEPLRNARAQADTTAFYLLARRLTSEWRLIRAAYLDAATSPQHWLILDRWFAAALSGHHGTQLHH